MLRRAASLGSGAVGACTESLGSESGDVGGDAEIDHQLGQQAEVDDEEQQQGEPRQQAAASPEKKPPRLQLPPPMPRAADGAFVGIRAERRGGRLILTEIVRVDPRGREVFRASRDGGRLRLQFADDDDDRRDPGSADDGGSSEPAAAVPAPGAEVVGAGCCNDAAGEFCSQQQVAASRLVR